MNFNETPVVIEGNTPIVQWVKLPHAKIAIIAFICAIGSLVIGLIPIPIITGIITFPASIVAWVLGIMSWRRIKKDSTQNYILGKVAVFICISKLVISLILFGIVIYSFMTFANELIAGIFT